MRKLILLAMVITVISLPTFASDTQPLLLSGSSVNVGYVSGPSSYDNSDNVGMKGFYFRGDSPVNENVSLYAEIISDGVDKKFDGEEIKLDILDANVGLMLGKWFKLNESIKINPYLSGGVRVSHITGTDDYPINDFHEKYTETEFGGTAGLGVNTVFSEHFQVGVKLIKSIGGKLDTTRTSFTAG